MKRLRLLLLPLGALAELTALVTCWALALTSPKRAQSVMVWATRTFPPMQWYTGDDA